MPLSKSTPFATSAENAAGTVESKAVDPLGIREALNATGAAPVYGCRAWVNFNGSGTVAIRASGNVSSITDNGVGDYKVNFTTAIADSNYCVSLSSGGAGTTLTKRTLDDVFARTSGAVRMVTANTAFSGADASYIDLAVFR